MELPLNKVVLQKKKCLNLDFRAIGSKSEEQTKVKPNKSRSYSPGKTTLENEFALALYLKLFGVWEGLSH